jgi:hypothetical protein
VHVNLQLAAPVLPLRGEHERSEVNTVDLGDTYYLGHRDIGMLDMSGPSGGPNQTGLSGIYIRSLSSVVCFLMPLKNGNTSTRIRQSRLPDGQRL